MNNEDYPLLESRMGRQRLSDRMAKQAAKEAHLLHQGEGIFKLERYIPLDRLVEWGLALTGIRWIAHRNFLGVRLVVQEWSLARLPAGMDQFRLLQLTDLHLDLDPALTAVVADLVERTPHDAAVVTGDYRNRTDGDYVPCMREMEKITRVLSPNRWGILGNHDFIEMVPSLESAGLPVLLNEVTCIEREASRLWIAGIDDPHFYHTHDLHKVRKQVPDGDCVILLSHSPEIYEEASGLGFDLQLSGHTHGGQLCLPGGFPLVVPCRVPKRFVRGRWTCGNLQGYTSPGTGSCGVAARLNCPPEITLHILRAG